MTQTHHLVLIIISALLFVLMIIMNVLANKLPLGGQTTGAVSDRYPNLFQPSGMTFSIWGIIYLLLGVFVVVQLLTLGKPLSDRQDAMGYVLLFFAISSIFNILWLLAWHHNKILLSTIVMVMLLATRYSQSLDSFTRASFSIYAGWISVATIANITILLVSYGAPSFSSWAVVLSVVILIVGALIGGWFTLNDQNIFYGGVFVWAYLGILMRHLNQEDLTQSYPSILWTSALLIIGFVVIELILLIRQFR
ncbi:MAG TPA: hypothetical protein PLP48_06470 [Acholeplasmataceae bacterium]|nr:hypothetical protein [Acholeplasmataceae bacterium]